MREIRPSGSEGGGAGNSTSPPYPYYAYGPPGLSNNLSRRDVCKGVRSRAGLFKCRAFGAGGYPPVCAGSERWARKPAATSLFPSPPLPVGRECGGRGGAGEVRGLRRRCRSVPRQRVPLFRNGHLYTFPRLRRLISSSGRVSR